MGLMDGKVAIVTGSARGIGAGIAQRLADEGASILVNSRSSADEGTTFAASLPCAVYQQADLTTEGAGDALVERAMDEFGRLDLLVNNAAGIRAAYEDDPRTQTPEVWDFVLQTNLIATYQTIVASLDALRRSLGSIVNISSVIGLRPWGPSAPYAVSKAGINHLTKLLAVELGPEIRVNAVSPGFTETAMTGDMTIPGRVALRDDVIARAPLRRTGRPEDVAWMVVALAASEYTTGQIVSVDGGYNLVR